MKKTFRTLLLLSAAAWACPASKAEVKVLAKPIYPAAPNSVCAYAAKCYGGRQNPYFCTRRYGCPDESAAAHATAWAAGTGGTYEGLVEKWLGPCEEQCAQLFESATDPGSSWHCDMKQFNAAWACLSGDSQRCRPAKFCDYQNSAEHPMECSYSPSLALQPMKCCTAKSRKSGECDWQEGMTASVPPVRKQVAPAPAPAPPPKPK